MNVDELEEGEHEEQDYNPAVVVVNLQQQQIGGSNKVDSSPFDKLSFDNIFKVYLDNKDQSTILLEQKLKDNKTTSSPTAIETYRLQFNRLLYILNQHDNIDESIDFILLFYSIAINNINNNNNNDHEKLDDLYKLFNNNVHLWFDRPPQSTERMESIIHISNIIEKNDKHIDLLYIILIPLLWEQSDRLINNIIRYIGSLVSFSISMEFYKILEYIDLFQQSLKPHYKPNVISLPNNNDNDNNDDNIDNDNNYILPTTLNQLFDSQQRCSDNSNNQVNWSNENAWSFMFYLTNQLLIDHLILFESNSFEQLPRNSYRFSSSLLKIILSYYLNPLNTVDIPNSETIIPKLISMVINHWIISRPLIIVEIPSGIDMNMNSDNKNNNNNNNITTILQLIVRICIFGSSFQHFDLISGHIDRIHSTLLNLLYKLDNNINNNNDSNNNNRNDNYTKLKDIIKSNLSIDFFLNCIDHINNSNNNKESVLYMTNRLAQIIQLLCQLKENEENDDNNNMKLKESLTKLSVKTPLISMILKK
ncbi:hypothetical protein PPL_11925 [Heterostelium album PN500]|uniref:Uncharacterized protein n=1 Tax=Heterostelium pallidum (strain ATCC 26659 / Pp 5 / PN500) TaxID=670386 RepID=D3BUV3_HETP5|nr:hypothetical protein PPL_11925 [Heterostelium album PN500]EFA74891.1 hypothetical protein PPL_11925 [Heterostelium album PN500]|eukprot:XP_020427025.1 hypothetical protein PPL_11925 [Heterostelium album PN500]